MKALVKFGFKHVSKVVDASKIENSSDCKVASRCVVGGNG